MIDRNTIVRWHDIAPWNDYAQVEQDLLKCNVKTYHFDELLGTKMRALYQRKKGRDLFDLYHALTTVKVNTDDVIACYKRYMEFVVAQPPSYKQYVANMEMKMQDDEFLHDMDMLIRPELSYAPITAYETVKTQLIDKLK